MENERFKISCFLTELNASLAGSCITVEWDPTELNTLHFNAKLNNPFLSLWVIWSPSVFEALLTEKVDKYFGGMEINYNNTHTIFGLYPKKAT